MTGPDLGEEIQVTIDGVVFTIRDFDYKTASRLSAKLFPILGAALRGMSAEFKDGKTPNANNQGAWLELFGTLLPEISPELLEEVRSTCAKFSSVDLGTDEDGRRMVPELSHDVAFNRCFRRKMGLMYRWIGECLKYNYADFLAGLASAQAKQAALSKTEPSRPKG
jgi:hypothetical protein